MTQVLFGLPPYFEPQISLRRPLIEQNLDRKFSSHTRVHGLKQTYGEGVWRTTHNLTATSEVTRFPPLLWRYEPHASWIERGRQRNAAATMVTGAVYTALIPPSMPGTCGRVRPSRLHGLPRRKMPAPGGRKSCLTHGGGTAAIGVGIRAVQGIEV